MSSIKIPGLLALAVVFATASLVAQKHTDGSGAGSLNFFSQARAAADGGKADSTTYAVTVTLGQQEPAAASSSTFALSGGFLGNLDVSSSAPWLTSVNKPYVMPRRTDLVWLSGARLNLGTTMVSVDGRAATVVATSATDVAIQLPVLPEPGWHRIDLSNAAGTTTLERGIGVMPLLFTEGASASDIPYDIVFKGTKGDLVMWAIGINSASPLPIGAYLHGLAINPSVVRLLPAMTIQRNDGVLRFSVPAVPQTFTLFAQALFLSTNPGYAPGSFSNLLEF